MEAQAQAMVALDVVSALFMAAVAARLGFAAFKTRRATPALLAAGLGIVALTYPTVAASALDLGREPDLWDHLRLVGQTGGALVVLFAYLSARRTGRARPLLTIGWAAVGVTLLYGALLLIPAAGTFPPLEQDLAAGHVVMAIAYALAGGLAASGERTPTLVPIALGGLAVGKVLWVFADVGARTDALTLAIYAVRLVAVGALCVATFPPENRVAGGAHAQA